MNNANNQKSYSAHIMIHLNGNDGGGIKTVSEALHCAFHSVVSASATYVTGMDPMPVSFRPMDVSCISATLGR